MKATLGTLPPDSTTELPTSFPTLATADWDDPMKTAMTPVLSAYWKQGGDGTRSRIAAASALDLGPWEVRNPHTQAAIREAAFSFCHATNATTDKDLAGALARLRTELHAGVVDHGESIPELTKRVKGVFAGAETWRAKAIAQTEACRAVHAGQLDAAEASGVVAGMEWMISADACPLCKQVHAEARMVPLGEPFAYAGKNPAYRTVRHPPLHPEDRCTVVEVLRPEYGGPVDPTWSDPIDFNAGTQHAQPAKENDTAQKHPSPAAAAGAKILTPGNALKALAIGAALIKVSPEAHRIVTGLVREWEAAQAALKAGHVADLWSDLPIPASGPVQDRIAAYLKGDGGRRLEMIRRIPDEVGAHRKAAAQARAAAEAAWKQHNIETADPDTTLSLARTLKAARHEHEVLGDLEAAVPFLAAKILALDAGTDGLVIRSKIAANHPSVARVGVAEEFLKSTFAADAGSPKGVDLNIGYLKTRGKLERAHYEEASRKVWLNGGETEQTIVHELGHAIEHQVPNVGDLAQEFLDYRVGDEQSIFLCRRFPDQGFDGTEKGREDKFAAAFGEVNAYYAGKEYRAGKQTYATEILAMGMEMFMSDPVHFARADPEFAGFIMGVMRGVIR
jgi:hypothetical protein